MPTATSPALRELGVLPGSARLGGPRPADWETDIHLSYPIKVGDKSRLTVVADVFNLFNRQAINQFDERYNLPSDGDACAGIPAAICGARRRPRRTSRTRPTRSAVDPEPARDRDQPRLPEEGASAFTQPRSIRLGVRFTF